MSISDLETTGGLGTKGDWHHNTISPASPGSHLDGKRFGAIEVVHHVVVLQQPKVDIFTLAGPDEGWRLVPHHGGLWEGQRGPG